MSKTAVYLHAVVQPGNRIELDAPAGLIPGDELDVVLLTESTVGNRASRTVADVLDTIPSGLGGFKSSQEVDAYIRGERDSWER